MRFHVYTLTDGLIGTDDELWTDDLDEAERHLVGLAGDLMSYAATDPGWPDSTAHIADAESGGMVREIHVPGFWSA